MPMGPAGSCRNSPTGTTTSTAVPAVTLMRLRSSGEPSLASNTRSGLPRSVHGVPPRFAMKTASANESVVLAPAATACSCEAAHFASPVASDVGDDL